METEAIRNTITIVKRVEKTHRNLGLPVVFAKMIDLSNLGLLIVAERGRGKGAILDCIKQLRHRKLIEVSKLTPAGLKKIADDLSDSEVTFINPDISFLYTQYLKDAAINVLASLIYDHRLPQSWTDRYQYKIENCYLSFIGGTQAKMLRALNKLPNWESMYKDRFIRFCLFYPLGTPNYTKEYPKVGTIMLPADYTPDQVSIPRSIKHSQAYLRMRAIIEKQTSEGRAGQYIDQLLKAHAYLNEREVVIEQDLEVMELFTLNLMADYWLSERLTPAGSLKFEPDSYVLLFYLIEHGSATRKELREYFKVTDKTLVKYMKPLLERNIATGVYGSPVYKLNPEWYTRYVYPIIKWHQKIGILEEGQKTLTEVPP